MSTQHRGGSTNLEVTDLGVGAGPLGNLYREVSDEDAASLQQSVSIT